MAGSKRGVGFVLLAATVLFGPQAAALGALGRFLARTHGGAHAHRFVPLAVALVALNVALVFELRRSFQHRPIPAALRFGLFYPYYVWWSGSMMFALVGGWAHLVTLPFVLAGALAPLAATGEPVVALLCFAAAAWGVWGGQSGPRAERVEVSLAGLGRGWAGARVVHLSDIHAGRHVGRRRLERMARRAAALRPDLVLVTGDVVDASAEFAEPAARVLASIPATHGVYACLGNHDYYAGADRVVDALQRAGVRVLRNEGLQLERNGDRIWLAGVDDAWFRREHLPAALRGRPDGMPTVLLSHHPELFPEAARAAVGLQLSGHTHGGQVGLLRVHPSLSLARLVGPFVAGLYRRGDALLYVNRGAGSVEPLVRLGASPEITVLTLRQPAASSAAARDSVPEAA